MLLQNTDSLISSGRAAVSTEFIPYVGTLVEHKYLRLKSDREEYGLGDIVAVQTTYDGPLYLTYIVEMVSREIFAVRYASQYETALVHIARTRKLKKVVLKAVLSKLVPPNMLFLPFSPTFGLVSHVAAPSIGKYTMRPKREGEKYKLGELVAVENWSNHPDYGDQCVRICRLIRGGLVQYRESHFGTLLTTASTHFKKLESQEQAQGMRLQGSVISEISQRVFLRPVTVPSVDSVASFMVELLQSTFCVRRAEIENACATYGLQVSDAQRTSNEQRLLSILAAHNIQFLDKVNFIEFQLNCAGSIEERVISNGSQIYVQADIHGDLASLVSLLHIFRQSNFLDETYTCRPGFYMVFLGDYLDRGLNSIEVLSLLLLLRMKNPNTVYLLLGNHESEFGSFRSEGLNSFFQTNKTILNECFSTFPWALCVGSSTVTSKGIREYVHFSHALFSPAIAGISFLRGHDSVFPICDKPLMAISILPPSRKAQAAFQSLVAKFGAIPSALTPLGYLWSDVEEVSAPSSRGLGYVFSPDDIHTTLQASKNATIKVCACIRGHQHLFKEALVPRKQGSSLGTHKVIVTSLPASLLSGLYNIQGATDAIQGLFLTVSDCVRSWEKVALFAHVDEKIALPTFRFHTPATSMCKPLLG